MLVLAHHTTETAYVWQDGVRMTGFFLLAVSSALLLRFIWDHQNMPKTTLVPIGAAVLAFGWEMIQHWHERKLFFNGAPLGIIWSVSIIMILWRTYVVRRK